MNPNHYLAVAIQYLFGGGRPGWPSTAQIGKTLVSSSMIDRVAAALGKPMVEVPVGFKWFVPGLIDGSFGFGGEESAGRVVPADGRHHVDHRQGRADPRPARLGDPREDRPVAERALRRPGRRARRPGVRPHRRARHPRAEGQARRALARRRDRHRAGRRADHREAHRGARQPRQDRRPQGHHRVRLVRRPALGHRGRLQDLRRVVPGPRAPRRGAGRGEGRRGRRPVRVVRGGRGRSARRGPGAAARSRAPASPGRPARRARPCA